MPDDIIAALRLYGIPNDASRNNARKIIRAEMLRRHPDRVKSRSPEVHAAAAAYINAKGVIMRAYDDGRLPLLRRSPSPGASSGSTAGSYAPSHHAPSHHAPSHHAPSHHAPSHHAPSHHAPSHHAPSHHAPSYSPSYTVSHGSGSSSSSTRVGLSDGMYRVGLTQSRAVSSRPIHAPIYPRAIQPRTTLPSGRLRPRRGGIVDRDGFRSDRSRSPSPKRRRVDDGGVMPMDID